MDQQGLLIVNQDDDNSGYLETQQFKGKIITVGIKKEADYRAYDLQYKDVGMSFKMKLHGQEIELYIPILGEHHVYNALNAVAVADLLGFSPLDIQAGLNFKKPPRRLTIYNCRDDITVIDDTVHSHPQGVRAALDVLKNIATNRSNAAISKGMDPSRVHHFINKDQLHALLEKLIKPHDTILVKGASKTNMFETVKFLDQTFKEE